MGSGSDQREVAICQAIPVATQDISEQKMRSTETQDPSKGDNACQQHTVHHHHSRCNASASNKNNKKLAILSKLVLLLAVGLFGARQQQPDGSRRAGDTAGGLLPAADASPAVGTVNGNNNARSVPTAASDDDEIDVHYLDDDDDGERGVDDDEDEENNLADPARSVERYRTLDDYLADVSGNPRRSRNRGDSGSAHGGSHNKDDVIVVATVGGTIAGISRSTGRTLWKQTGPGDGNENETAAGAGASEAPNLSSSSSCNSDSSDSETCVPDASSEAKPSSTKATSVDTQVGLFSPLVSTTTTTKSGSGSGRGGDWRTAAVPSVDGKVYLTPGRDKSIPLDVAAATAVTTARELVNRAPFVDARGRFYVGSRTATAAALDRDTGEILRLVGGDGSTSGVVGEDREEVLPSLEGRNVVWIGRTDYSVSVFDARTGDVDVRFSTSEVLSVGDMFRGGQIGPAEAEADGTWDNGMKNPLLPLPGGEGEEAMLGDGDGDGSLDEEDGDATSPSLLVATPSGSLALRDPITGHVAWVSDATFETPVAYAVDSSGGKSIGVDIVPDAVVPCDDKEYVKEELERQLAQMEGRVLDDAGLPKQGMGGGDAGMGASATDETIVGALDSGQLFAMPLGNAKRANYRGRRQPFLPGLPHPLPSSRTQGANQASSRQWHREPRHHPHAVGGETGDWQNSYHASLQQQQDQHGSGGAASASTSTSTSLAMIKSSCRPGQPNFPSCLVGSRLKQQEKWRDYDGDGIPDGDGSFLDPNRQKFDPRSDAALKALITGYHLNPDYFDGSMWADPDLYDEDGRSQQQKRSRFKTFLRIMSSWVPPAVALAFVISFELGRRERLKAEKMLTEKSQAEDDTSEVSLTKALAADGEVRSQGVVGAIKVTDEVLGYGGHGTVVYRGSLDGRSVAVKRMLKAYHASANREISLLIESDGHPNVVRYFLKEVRGDFVYLALELCDMSLHDLIGAIGEHEYWQKGVKKTHCHDGDAEEEGDDGAISHATRDTLLQIASGVSHLHSLRIVHRDLKPQNILLAHQDRNKKSAIKKGQGVKKDETDPTDTHKEEEDENVYELFEQGEYVPKISDMGLGKQLHGQSSFGLSTLGNASAGLAATGTGAQGRDVAGAGPGSVGWQAPEVMAQRRYPEGRSTSASMMRTCSDVDATSPDPALIEASPMEGPSAAARTSRSVDIFSLGCIFYCTIIPGSHPFGEWYEREANIMKNEPNTGALEEISVDASDLVVSMIARDAKQRPTAAQVCRHPFFWDPAKRLAFLCQLSDRLEATSPTLVDDGQVPASNTAQRQSTIDPFLVERNAAAVVGSSWDKDLDQGLLTNVSRFRTYDPSSVRDLLRLIRNKYHHFDELPDDVKMRLGPNPTDLIKYFERRFPRIVMHCYHVCQDNLTKDDPLVIKYGIPATLECAGPQKRKEALSTKEAVQTHQATAAAAAAASTPKSSYYKVLASTRSSITDTESEGLGAEVVSDSLAMPESPISAASSEEKIQGEQEKIQPIDTSVEVAKTLQEVTCPGVIGKAAEPSAVTEEVAPPAEQHEAIAKAQPSSCAADGMVVWEGSTAAKTFNCRGWYRSEDEWRRRVDSTLRKRNADVARCATDPKFRTRLCNHWDVSQGTHCPMRKKKKCIFAHGPVELRVKEGKKKRWGKLVDADGNCSNPRASGGEDTYGAAKSIETMREKEGKWTPNKKGAPNNRNTGRYQGKQSGGGGKKGGSK